MAEVCPECKATLDDPSKPCEWCGHAPGKAAAGGASQEGVTAPPPPDYAAKTRPEGAASAPRLAAATAPPPPRVPSMTIDEPFADDAPRPGAPPKPAIATPAPSPAIRTPLAEPSTALRASREQILDGGLDEGPALELDVGGESAPPAERPAAASAASIHVDGGAAPPELDPSEIRMVARFGIVPESWWSTPLYVRSVRARQGELAKEVVAAEEHYLASKTALDDALLAIALRAIAELRGMPTSPGAYQKTLDALAKHEADLRSLDANADGESETQRETVRALKAPATSSDGELQGARALFRAACVDFAERVVDDRTNFGEDYEEPRARIARLRNARDAANKSALLHHAAMGAFDAEAFATGQRVTYLAVGLAALSFAALAFSLK